MVGWVDGWEALGKAVWAETEPRSQMFLVEVAKYGITGEIQGRQQQQPQDHSSVQFEEEIEAVKFNNRKSEKSSFGPIILEPTGFSRKMPSFGITGR